ncbi:MAG: carboxypeptidase-like regulatory domain-containing protein [Candidatus Aenigmatarchaeota archaeon]
MKRALFLAVVMLLLSIQVASAAPVIQNVSISPSSPWLGENVNIYLSCADSLNNSIESVYADITGPSITLPRLHFSGYENYQLTVSKDYLDRTGLYNAMIYCKNNLSNVSSNATSFYVSSLIGYISIVNPEPAYIGDTITIDFVLEKDGARITTGAAFNVSLNGVLKTLKVVPAYDSIRGWILKLDAPTTSGNYDLDAVAFYGGTSVSDSDTIDVRNSIEFEIVSMDKNWIKGNDNMTVVLRAMEKGSVIDLDKSDVGIKIGSGDAEVTGFSRQGDTYVANIIAPTLSPGRYQLEAYLYHAGKTYSDSRSVDYIVAVSGDIVDANNKAVSTQIKFIQYGVTKLTLSSDSYGHYSGSIPLGTYDITVSFPKSKLELTSVLVNNFDDPINHFYGDDFEITGLRNAGVYNYDIDLTYSIVRIEMDYNEKNIVDENNLRVYRCSEWNSGKKVCNDEWEEIGYEIDMIRNKAKVNSSSLSAFVIGEVKDINVIFSLDKEEYNLDEKIKVSGIVKDADGKSVSNASLRVYIKNTLESLDTIADNNGVFSLELDVPENEGEYLIVVEAEKEPYNDFKGEKSFDVVKSRSLFIDFPETVRIERGKNFSQEFTILNNGQINIDNIMLTLEGLPSEYYNIRPETIGLDVDESRTIYIDFSVPVYAETGISSVSLKAENEELSEEIVFGFNVFEEDDQVSVPTTGLATGFAIPQISYMELVYVGVFAVVCFSAAILLKKRTAGDKRSNIRSFLFGVRKYMSFDDRTSVVKKDGSYDKLIITEFPNVLKFSNNLTQTEKGDK